MPTARRSSPTPTEPMEHSRIDAIPKPIAFAALGLMAFALLAAIVSNAERDAARRHALAPVESMRTLTFHDRDDGGVDVLDWRDEQRVWTFAPGDGGFMRTAIRAHAHNRRMAGLGGEAPFHLKKMVDGRLVLEDPATGKRIGLDAFGEAHAAQFAQLLTAEAVDQ